MTAFMCSWPDLYSTVISGCFRCTRSPMLGWASACFKLFGGEIIFEEFQPMWARYRYLKCVTDRQTDAMWVNTALCIASRGKNHYISWIVGEIVKRLSIRAWHLFIADWWRQRSGTKENFGFYELHSDSTRILPPFWGCLRCTRLPLLRLVKARTLSYSAMQLFAKCSNLCENHTDGQTTCNLITALCVASCGNKRYISAYTLYF